MIVYGRNPVREALRGPRQVFRVWATKNAAREPWLAALRTAPVLMTTPEELSERSGSEAHQGVCAEVSAFGYADPESLLGDDGGDDGGAVRPCLLVALDQVQDPQNLGAIARTAECAGAAGLIIPERRSAEVTGAVCKASAGAVEHLPIARVRNLADFLAQAKIAGMWCYGASADAAVDYRRAEFADRAVVVLGSEGRGLRPRVAAACDLLIAIPLRGQIESLSVSAAAAVLLYAAAP